MMSQNASCGPYFGLSPIPAALESHSLSSVVARRDELLKQKDSIERQILSTNAFINACQPINRLPNEVLVEVFCIARDVLEDIRAWYSILCVCRLWYAVGCAAPMLWSLIDVGHDTNPMLFKKCLRNSRAITLDISFDHPSSLHDMLRDLRPQRARVRNLTFTDCGREYALDIGQFLRGPFPILKTLEVWLDPRLAENTPPPDDSDTDHHVDEEEMLWLHVAPTIFPCLRRLSLRGVAIHCDNFIPLTTLTQLHLSDCIYEILSIEQFLSLLEESSELEELVLSRYHPRDETDRERLSLLEEAKPLTPVRLSPKLRVLEISDIDFVIARLLSGMRIPTSTHVSVWKLVAPAEFGEDRTSEEILEFPIHRCFPADKSGIPILRAVDTVHVKSGRDDGSCLIVGMVGTRSAITILASGYRCKNHDSDLAEDFLELFRGAPLVELSVTGRIYDEWRDRDVLSHFPALERLTLGSAHVSYRAVLDALCQSTNTPGTVPCPNLRELTLRFHTDPDALVECLRRRFVAGSRLSTLYIVPPLSWRRQGASWTEQLTVFAPYVDVVKSVAMFG